MIKVPKNPPKVERKELISVSTPVDEVSWQELGFTEFEETIILTAFSRNRIKTVLDIYKKLFSKTYNFNGYESWDIGHTLILDPGIGDRIEALIGNKDREVFEIPKQVKAILGDTFGPDPRVPQFEDEDGLQAFFDSVNAPTGVATSIAPPMGRDRRNKAETEEIPAQPQRKRREMPRVVPTGATNGSGQSTTPATKSDFVVPNSTPPKETVWQAVTYYPRQLVALFKS